MPATLTRRNTLLNGYGGRTTFAAPSVRTPAPALPTPGATREMIRAYGQAFGWGGLTGPYYGFLASQTGETAEIRRQYVQMAMREGSVKAPLLARVWSVASLDLQVLPADKKNQRDKEIAEGYRQAILRSWLGLPHVVAEIGLPAAVHGHSLCEMPLKEEIETRGKYAGRRMIEAIKAKHPDTYQLRTNDYGKLVGVRPSGGGWTAGAGAAGGKEAERDFPPDRFIYYPWLSMYGDLQGVSDLRAAFRGYTNKDALWKLRRFFLDKLSGGFLLATGVSDTARPQMETALATARACGFLTCDVGQEVKVLDLAMGTADQFKSAIDDCDREMQIAVSGSHLPFQEGQTPDARGNSQVQKQVSTQAEWKLAADVGFLLTQAAHLWVDENYLGADYPTGQLGGVDPAAALQDANLMAVAHAFVPLSRQEVYERLSLSPPADAADTIPVASAAPAGGPAGQFADAGQWYVEAVAGKP